MHSTSATHQADPPFPDFSTRIQPQQLLHLPAERSFHPQQKSWTDCFHLIKLQGQRYQDMLNRRLPPQQQLALRFSNGWLDKFCQRHSFKQQVAHGESASVQQDIINQELPLQHLVSRTTRLGSVYFLPATTSGTEKLDLLFIGHQKQSPEQLGIHYFSNKKKPG